jgi:transcriptional regulator with XRE-family HTH domain
MRRTNNQLNKTIKPFELNAISLNTARIHRAILKKLNELDKPQAYLNERIGISRATLWRLSQNKDITMETYFKLIQWLDVDFDEYINYKTT